MIKRFRHTNIFYKFLISYILLILIPIVGLGSLSYIVFSNSIQKEAQRNNALILSNMSDNLDQQLASTKNMMYQTVLNLTGSQTDYTKLQDAISLVARIINTDKFIDDVFVYYPEGNRVIRSDGLYEADFFFQHYYKYQGFEPAKWLDGFSRSDFTVIPTQNILVRDHEVKRDISFLTSFPLFNHKIEGTLVVMINAEKLQSIMNNSLHASEGQSQIVIMNDNSETIASSNLPSKFAAFIDNDKMLFQHLLHEKSYASGDEFINTNQGKVSLSYINSRTVDWKYIVLTSINQISKQADSIRFSTLVICSVLLLLGIVLAIKISHNFTKPIYEIMNIFKTDSRLNGVSQTRSDELQVILKHLRLVMSDHHELAANSEINQKLLKDYYVKSVILGNDVEKTDKLEKLETVFIYSLYTVIVIRIVTEDLSFEASAKRTSIKNQTIDVIESMVSAQNEIVGLLTNTGGDNISILTNFQDYEVLKKQLESIKDQISDKLETRLWIGVGNAYEKLQNINQSYKEACLSLQHRQMNLETQILHYADCIETKNQQKLQFSAEVENQLTWAVMAGDQAKVALHLHALFERLDESHTFIQIQQFGQNLLRIIDKLIAQNQLQKSKVLDNWYDLFEVNDTFTLNEMKDYLLKTYQKTCDHFYARTEIRDKKLEDDLLSYIYQYYNQDLSLDLIAANFNMNPKYVSRYFKEHFGINFLDFVNQFRVTKAKELLIQEPNLQINKIANQVGIYNANTFISVFKKYEGVTPGRYREISSKIHVESEAKNDGKFDGAAEDAQGHEQLAMGRTDQFEDREKNDRKEADS